MKKLLIATMLVVSLAASAFASGTGTVSSVILRSFELDYKKASDVQWTAGSTYMKATFVYNNERMEAYYNVDGEVFATAKGLNVDNLPTAAKRKFAQKYGEYIVKEAIEYKGLEEEAYFISAENDTESVIVKVTREGSVSEFKKTKK